MSTSDRHRVLVAVVPPLLSDLLGRLIARQDLEVVVLVPGSRLHSAAGFSVALVNRDVDLTAANVHTVVRLPLTRDGLGRTRVTGPGRDDWVELAGLGELISLIDRLCPHRSAV